MYKREIGYCIIVDAYSTGKAIAPLLSTYSFIPFCIHIKSSPTLPADWKHNENDFNVGLEYNGENLNILELSIREIITTYPIHFITAGSESGVELTDTLNAIFQIPGNDPTKSHLRRNKFLMNEAVKDFGVKTVDQIKIKSANAAIEWASSLPTDAWPIVLKPLESQSGDHVFFCNNNEEIHEAFFNISSAPNLFGQTNHEVLVQSFNDGEEFIVNSVSHGSHHFMVEIWRIKKTEKTTIYEHADLVDPACEEYRILQEAACQVLDAVGTCYGAGTTEFKLHPEKGAVFLETTSRPMAGSPLNIIHELLGYNQVTLMLEAFLTPEIFKQRLTQPLPCLTSQNYGLIVVLISDAEGKFQEDLVSIFCALPTYKDSKIGIKKGEHLNVTIDSLTSPGEVYLIGEKCDVMRDYETIRTFEKNGLYRDNTLVQEAENRLSLTSRISGIKETFFENNSCANTAALTSDCAELN